MPGHGQWTSKEVRPLKGLFLAWCLSLREPWAGVHAEPVSTSLLMTIDGERSQGPDLSSPRKHRIQVSQISRWKTGQYTAGWSWSC